MKIIREVTDWDFPSHTYAFTGEKIVAYRVKSTGEIRVFSKPMRFEQRDRRFETVRDTQTIQAFGLALNEEMQHETPLD